jgi:hypothetical protein|tara:strand:+ start:843 stop:1085 length:243 start_codon:yes stop_codon:yes gene_type:complete
MKKEEIPTYYKGKNGYMAKDVVANFDLTYNLGSAMKYIIRCGKKEGNPPEQDIRKAINHLHFELDRLYKASDVKTGGLAQ